jgi:iron complex transport system substrate-binding protein
LHPYTPILLLSLVAWVGGCESPADGGHDAAASADVDEPVLRIVSLAPHLAELVFTVGAGDLLVGVTAYTDYPQAATSLPLIGDAFAVDQERLAVLKPDLLLAWQNGTPAHVVDELRGRGYRVETIETRGLGDVAAALETIGRLTGHGRQATDAAYAFRQGIAQLAERHLSSEPISVFYQVSERPLYTISGDHYVSELIETCGGQNIFGDLDNLAPLVDVEAVLARDPEVLLASDDSPYDAFTVWQRWPTLAANRYDNRFFLPANEIGRATPRLLRAGQTLCDTLDEARGNRASAGK